MNTPLPYTEILEYRDGDLYWKSRSPSLFSTKKGYSVFCTRYEGRKAGNLGNNGYMYVRVAKRLTLMHRIVWEMHNGPIQSGYEIDHIDRCPVNNRIENLRLARRKENGRNTTISNKSTTGYKGVHLFKRTGRYSAKYKKDGKQHHIGYFDTAEEAHEAYRKAIEAAFGEFANP
jgi:hypothetical protein